MTDKRFLVLLIAAAGNLVIPFFIAPFSEYNHLTTVMSALGNSGRPLSALYNCWLIIAGAGFAFSAVTLYKTYSTVSVPLAVWLSATVAVYAIGGCILSGIFPVGETKALTTIAAKIHGIGSSVGFTALTFCPLFTALLSFREKKTAVGAASLISFAAAVTFFALFIMSDKEQFSGTIISYEGLWQRLSLLCMYAPLIIVSLEKLIRKSS